MRAICIRRKLVTPFAAVSLALGGALMVIAAGPSVAASTVSPTTTDDDGSVGSLRALLEGAGTGDTVTLTDDASYQLTRCLPAATPGFNAIHITARVTIEGNGATIEQTCADRVLLAQSGITLKNVTITGGDADGDGGGLQSSGELTITDSTFIDNHASGSGGGVQSSSSDGATITGSTFSQNTAAEFGGGLESSGGLTAAVDLVPVSISGSVFFGNTASGEGAGGVDTEGPHTLSVADSTFTANHGGTGGGIGMFGGQELSVVGSTFDKNISEGVAGAALVTGTDTSAQPGEGSSASFVNSTITGNTQGGWGAVLVGGKLSLSYVTINSNSNMGLDVEPSVGEGRGILHAAAENANAANVQATDLTSFASVITMPAGGTDCASDNAATSHGYNFVDDASCDFLSSGDRQTAGDPGLGALGANGGPTQTQLPTASSVLVGAVPVAQCQADGAAGVTTDQRGITRPQGSGCDIGAVEAKVTDVLPGAGLPIEALPLVVPRFTG